MRIEKEGSAGFKVELTGCELNQFNLTYNQLDYKEQRTRTLLHVLSRHVGAVMGFDSRQKLMIEVFPAPGQGCVIYFTFMGRQGKRYRPLLPKAFLFNDCEALYAGVEQLGKVKGKSELFRKDRQYVLVLYGDVGKELKEYAKPYSADRLALAHLREHGALLATPNAVDTLLKRE